MSKVFPSLSEEDISKLLTREQVRALYTEVKGVGIERLVVSGKITDIVGDLGAGGTKEVYDVVIQGQHYALAFPNFNDSHSEIIRKWRFAVREEKQTDTIRDLGFIVNPIYQVVDTSVNGVTFPGVLMKRYGDLGFPVYDSKNVKSQHEMIGVDQKIDEDSALEFFAQTVEEIARLLKEGVCLGRDCFNLCEIEGNPRLYLNDLGHSEVKLIGDGSKGYFAESYTQYAISAFVKTVSERVYRQNHFVNTLASIGTFHESLKDAVLIKYEEIN